MNREQKILILSDNNPGERHISEIFDNHFSGTAVIFYDSLGHTSRHCDEPDIVIVDLTGKYHTPGGLLNNIAARFKGAFILVLTSGKGMEELPAEKSVVVFRTGKTVLTDIIVDIIPLISLQAKSSAETDCRSDERRISDLVMNNSRSMLTIINRDYIYEKVNNRFCRFHGVDRSGIEGRSVMDVWGKDSFNSSIKPNIDKCLKGELIRYEADFEVKKQGRRFYDVAFYPFLSEKGEVTRIVAETFDITKEVELQNKLARAQRLEAVGALAGGIAHDFNNILTTIYGYAEMSLDEIDRSSPVYENISRIISAVSKARLLIRQILDFSRQMEQEMIPVNLWQVLIETITYVQTDLPAGVVIDDRSSDRNYMVMADPTQLFRVFLNLLTNAVQAMSRGGVITIEMECTTAPGDTGHDTMDNVSVTVSDSGEGMDVAVLERIFEPFFSTRAPGKGTGLGLSVVHGIVTEMHGSIDVASEKGKGTTFTVTLPLVKTQQKNVPEKATCRGNLLFVTENMYESRMLSMGLVNIGYNLSIADTPEKLLRYLRDKSSTTDLIIFMDGLHGFSFADFENMLAGEMINLPVLLIVGSEDMLLTERLLNSDFVRQFLIKPVSLREMRNAIETAFNTK